MRQCYLILSFFILLIGCNEDDDENFCAKLTSIIVTDIESTSVIVSYDFRDNTNYEIEFGSPGFKLGTGTELIVAANSTAELSDLLPNTTYEVYVRAVCSNNTTSEYSEPILFTTAEEVIEITCFPPINISAEVIDYNETLISWKSASNNEQSFEIEYDVSGFELGTGIQKPAFENELLIDALIVGTSYDYYMRSYCQDEISEFTGPFMFTTRACVIPSNFIISEISTTTALASWEGNGEVSWELEYGEQGFELGEGEVIFLGETEVEIQELLPMTNYEIYLRANCGPNGRSDYLDPLSFTTL